MTLLDFKKINKEYLLLFVFIVFCVFLIYSNSVVSQGSPEELTLSTYYPFPDGNFATLRVRRFVDFDNHYYWVEPFGRTFLKNLAITGDLTLEGEIYGYDDIWAGLRGLYHIDLNETVADDQLYLQSFSTDGQIYMDAPSPSVDAYGVPIEGHHVWDISEGIAAVDCQAGDLVVISAEEDKILVRSRKKFSQNIAGVISEDPKIYMGPAQGKQPLALTGIVKCNAVTENGAIKKGDLLVSSSTPGYAMRADPQEISCGMVAGKALENLDKGSGKILILVNKQ